MDELEQQIEAWADAAAPPADGAVTAASVIDRAAGVGRSWRGRRLPLLAAAAAVVVVVVGAAVAVAVSRHDGSSRVETAATTAPTETTAPSGTTGPAPDVAFEVLSVGEAGATPMGTLRAASNAAQLAALWSDDGLTGAVPEVDFATRVVVAITIPDDACPPTLSGFKRDGTTLEPRFVEPQGACTDPLIPKTFVVALDWATTGSRFRLFLPGQRTYDFTDTSILVDHSRPDPVLVDLDLSATEVAPGGRIEGTVRVSNDSGAVVTATGCGPPFDVLLANDRTRQERISPDCLQTYEFPVGESSYPVVVEARYKACTTSTDSAPPSMRICDADGQPPAMPPGTYRAEVQYPVGFPAQAAPATVTIT